MSDEGARGVRVPQGRSITAEEFERQYAERSGVTVEWLREQGSTVRTCDCDYEGCEGWQSVSEEAAERIDAGLHP